MLIKTPLQMHLFTKKAKTFCILCATFVDVTKKQSISSCIHSKVKDYSLTQLCLGMEPTLKVGSKRPATDSSFNERMYIICQTYVKSKKLSSLGEEGCDKLLQAASDRWDRCDYANIDVIDRLRLVDLKQLTQEKRVKYHRPCYSSFTSAFHIAKLNEALGPIRIL